jgi:hypothetical protein
MAPITCASVFIPCMKSTRLTRIVVSSLAALVCLLAGVPGPVRGSELEPHALAITRGADTLTVQGEHFALTWDAHRGGELKSIRIHDGIAWHELVEPGIRRTTVPGLLLTAGGEAKSPAFGPGELTVKEETPDRVVVESKASLRNEKGKECGLVLTQTSTIFPEGALFLDFALELPAGAKPLTVEKASLGVPLALGTYTLSFWHWQRGLDRGSGFLEPQPMFSSAYCPNVGLALGTSGNLSNQVEVVLESKRGLAGPSSLITTSIHDGRSILHWLHPEQSPPFTLTAPYRYTNRLGILLGRHPARSRLTAARLAHWIEGAGDGMLYPSPGAVAAMAECGATGVVLGESWRQKGEDPLAPADPAAFQALEHDLQARGMALLVTIGPQGDGEDLGRRARAAGIDGMLIQRGSAHYGGVGMAPEVDFPARAMFEWGRGLRQGLGPAAILIQQTGLEVPDLTLGLAVDGVAFGNEQADWRAARSTLANAYLGGTAFAVPCPLLTTDPMRTTRSLAIAAATGSVPLVPLGIGPQRSAYAARYALPVWQLTRLVEPGPGTDFYATGVGAMAKASNVDFWSTVYRWRKDAVLVVTANLSTADQDSTGLAVNLKALGMTGEYDVQMIEADSIDDLKVTFLGRSKSGQLKTNAIARFGVRGFLFTSGDTPADVAMALDQAVAVGQAVSSHKTPPTPTGLKAEPISGGIGLRWEPLVDTRPHAAAYRVYRSKDPAFRHPLEVATLGDVDEDTSFRDLSIGPGERWTYAVAARSPGGGEGSASASATATAPTAPFAWGFTDSSGLRGFSPVAGIWAWDDSAYGHGCRPDPIAFAMSLAPPAATFDSGEVAAVMSGPGGLHAGGLLVRSEGLGTGYALVLGNTPGAELVLGKVTAQGIEPLAKAPCPRSHADQELHTLRLVAAGTHLEGYADDRRLVAASDPTFTRGRVGVLALDGHVHFDNLTVRPTGGPGDTP